MSSTDHKQVLVMGLKSGNDSDMAKGAWPAERVLAAVNTQIDLAKRAGFDITSYLIDMSNSEDVIIDEVRALFKKQHWDGVSIGFGVRGGESFTPLFERLVNTAVEDLQPPPKFIFALRPHLIWEAIGRVFGVEQGSQ